MAVDYPNPWKYKGRAFTTEKIGDHYGFVYLIENQLTGQKYIGRKYFWQKRKPKGKTRRVTSESDWKKYYGSNDELKADEEDFEVNPIQVQLGKTVTLYGFITNINNNPIKGTAKI